MYWICGFSVLPDNVLARRCRVEEGLQVGMSLWEGLVARVASSMVED